MSKSNIGILNLIRRIHELFKRNNVKLPKDLSKNHNKYLNQK